MAPLLSCSSELRGSASSLMDLSEALLRPDTPLQDEPAFCMSPCDADDSVELAQLLARCEHDVFQCLPAFRWEESDVEGIGASLEPEAHDAAAVAGALAGCESSGILSQGSTKVARPPFSHRNGGPCDHCGVKGEFEAEFNSFALFPAAYFAATNTAACYTTCTVGSPSFCLSHALPPQSRLSGAVAPPTSQSCATPAAPATGARTS